MYYAFYIVIVCILYSALGSCILLWCFFRYVFNTVTFEETLIFLLSIYYILDTVWESEINTSSVLGKSLWERYGQGAKGAQRHIYPTLKLAIEGKSWRARRKYQRKWQAQLQRGESAFEKLQITYYEWSKLICFKPSVTSFCMSAETGK